MSNLRTADLIRITRRHLQGNARSPLNTLASAKDDASTQAVLQYPPVNIQIGTTVEIGWVLYQVLEVNTSTKTLTVLPDIDGTAIDHAGGARVTIRPRYSIRSIIEELNNELMQLPTEGIYKLRVVEPVNGLITVPDDALIVLRLRDNNGVLYPGNTFELSDAPVEPDTLEWTAGHAVFGCTLGEFSFTTDIDVTETGLVSSAEDLPPLGAALRLLAGLESQRNLIDVQGETRRAEEVPPGAVTGALRNLAAIRQTRLGAERARFQQRYGYKLHTAA